MFSPACGRDASKNKSAQEQPQAWIAGPEDLVRAYTGHLVTGPTISGELAADKGATVRAQLAGQVVEVNGDVGNRVQRGQVLVRVRALAERESVQSAKAAVETARTELAVAERDEQRTDALVEAGALAQRDLEQARAAVANAKARLAQAQAGLATAAEQLGESVARSPIDGAISSIPVSRGDVVSLGSELFTVINTSTMELEASVPSGNLGLVKVGTPVQFRVQGFGERTFTGRVSRISPAVDPNTNQIRVYATVPNASGALVSGFYAEGRIATGERDAVIVPADAVTVQGDASFVMAVQNGKAVRRPVRVGRRDEQTGAVQIESGIEEGALVLVGAAREVREGAAVEVRGDIQQPQGAPRSQAVEGTAARKRTAAAGQQSAPDRGRSR